MIWRFIRRITGAEIFERVTHIESRVEAIETRLGIKGAQEATDELGVHGK